MPDKNKSQFDSPWKDIIEFFFPQFMEFFVPGSENDIDWNKKIRFLDKEFQKITKDSELGRRYTDKLVEVTLKNNTKKWILIHIEIQAGKEEEFSERMFVYNYRIFDRYKIPVTSIAVLADDSPSWHPQPFQYGMWGSQMGLDYIKTKLLDYKTNWSYLESRNNPFAIVVMAHLKALETKQNNSLRKQWKFELTKLLYEKGYSKKEVLNLYSFIDWVLNLPTELEEIFLQELNIYEEEKKMPYVTNAERIGEKRGKKIGEKIGEKNRLLSIIANAKQEGMSPEQTARITGLDKDLVKKIMENEETDIPLHLLDK
jgi:predicted transposase/invertase (TIGR01784 family)